MNNLKEQSGYIPNSVEATIEQLTSVRNEMDALKRLETDLKGRMLEMFQKELHDAYMEKSEPFGIVNIQHGNYKLKFDTPKKVKWDQEGLAALYKDGASVEVEYSVKETVFKAQDADGKDAFMPYRTVEPGSVSIKVEVND